LGSALDQENRELAERIQVDRTHIGGQSGDFKLLAQPFLWLSVSAFTKRAITMTIGQARVLWIVSPVMFGVSA
jgi:hypothetical protein